MRTPSSLLQNSHDTSHVKISLYWDFHPTRFLNTTLSTAEIVIISKTYRAKVSTADSPYVVEGKITLVAVVQKSWF